jgi:hypothetical protein
MPSENLELVCSICAECERGDFSHAPESARPEIEFVIADGPSPGHWQGLEGLADSWRDFLGAWEDARQDTEDYREIDNERVLVLTHIRGRGRASGLEVADTRTRGGGQAGLFHVRAGKVIRLIYYLDRERALADLGLAPAAALTPPSPLLVWWIRSRSAWLSFCSKSTTESGCAQLRLNRSSRAEN